MKRVFVIVLAMLLLTGCVSENVQAIQDFRTQIIIKTDNGYSIQGYNIRETENGYVVTVEVK